MNRSLFFLLALLAAVFVAASTGCSKKEQVKPVPEEVKVYEEAARVIETLRAAYLKKDEPSMRAATTEEGFESIRGAVKAFDSAELDFTIRWVEIKPDVIHVNVAWQGSWTVRGKAVAKEQGMAVFELVKSPVKVSRVIKGSPFVYPE